MNKNAVATINYSEYKDDLPNKKCFKIIKKEPTKSTKFPLSCFDDKIYILNHGYDELALGY